MVSFFITHVPPIIYHLFGFILGISLRHHYIYLVPLFLSAGFLLLWNDKQRIIAYTCIMFAFGSLWHQGYAALYEQAASTIPTTPITLTGRVIDIQKTNHRIFKNLVVISLDAIDGASTSWFNPHNKLHIYVTKYPSIEVDDVITIKDALCKKPPQSSYRDHLMREQTIATIFIPKLIPSALSRPTYSYKRLIYNTKILTTKKATSALLPVSQSLYASLFLGNKTYTSSCYESIKEQFRRWGLSHYLARSGLHLVLIVALWVWFFRIIPIPFLYKQLSIAFLVMLYAMLSWSSISFIRALSTFFLCKLCSCIWYYPYNNLHLLTVTALYLLIQNPLHIFYLDFQLSFGITFALAWLNLLKTYQMKLETQMIASS